MKTISVPDEVYDFLKSCKEELNTQDNRCTANPIFGFMIETRHTALTPDDYSFMSDDFELEITNTEKEGWAQTLSKYIVELYGFDIPALKKTFPLDAFEEGVEVSYEYFAEKLGEELELLAEYEDIFDGVPIQVIPYKRSEEMYQESVSFFESDIEAHAKLNGHNMPKNKSYVFYNNRTPKMNKLREILKDEIVFNEE